MEGKQAEKRGRAMIRVTFSNSVVTYALCFDGSKYRTLWQDFGVKLVTFLGVFYVRSRK
jgi:hypothetical protein